MARQYAQRLKPLYILDILRRKSDEEHPITAAEICTLLENEGIPAERKSVYRDISALSDYGYDIIKSSSPRGYFLGERELEVPEVCLLTDAVRTAKFISSRKTRELIKKLNNLVSENAMKERESRVFFSPSSKCDNEQIFYSIDKISTAVREGRKITFEYISNDLSDERTVQKNRRLMKISPYALTWQDDHYYVIGNYEKYDNLLHLRLDRMYSVDITDEKQRHFSSVSEYEDYFDVADYTSRLFGMHSGKLAEIEFKCSKKIFGPVLDRFGEKIYIKNVTENDFCFSVRAAVSDALVSWVIGYGKEIKVLSPEMLVEKIEDRALELLEIYRGQEK